MDIACRLAQYGFGRTLLQAAVMLQFVEFMDFVAKWRVDVCEVLKMDPRHLLGHMQHELARVIVEEHIEFPDLAVLGMYLLPLTSWSDGGHPPVPAVTSRQPDLVSLAAFCSQHLCWPVDTIQSRLMDVRAGTAMRALLQVRLANINMPTASLSQSMIYSCWAMLMVRYCAVAFRLCAISMNLSPCTRFPCRVSRLQSWIHLLLCICQHQARMGATVMNSMKW